jgi:mono/diheme cytochrome c family protein
VTIRSLPPILLLSALALALASCGSSGSSSSATQTKSAPAGSSAAASSPVASATTGKEIFAAANCASCHTFAAAGSKGTIGPNLDQVKVTEAIVTSKVETGDGPMPSFATTLTPAQIATVAKFVTTGR